MALNYILAIAPTVVLIIIVLSADKYQKEPIGLLVLLFLAGMITVIPAMILEQVYSALFGSLNGYIALFFEVFVGVALIEELVKYVAVKLIAYKRNSFDEIYDGIIYSVMVSLGFATVENILYVTSYGLNTAIVRAITAVPAHAMFAVTMGYFMGLSKAFINKKSFYNLMSFIAPVIVHGIYDFILFMNFDWALFVFVPYLIFLYYRSAKLIKSTYNQAPFK